MYHTLEARIRTALREYIRQRYGLEARVAIERPPKTELGEAASPVAFELARPLKRAPRQIAQEIAAALPPIAGVARWEVAGGGYLNAYFDRAGFFAEVMQRAGREAAEPPADAPKVIVEHTNINPNKAAHIGHLRNAALGDSFVRLLRHSGRRVEVQNYIDNTGVQVADVVVAFLRLEDNTLDDVRALAARPRFDYLCWDLYARVTQWFEEDKSRLALRAATLKAIEEGRGAEAEMAEMISTAIVRSHLATMERLGVEYDVLPRESEILHLEFWDAAFELLKERGAIELAAAGKNAGCWVMRMDSAGGGERGEAEAGEDDADVKIIVRSDGTVTYVGKDIAYQLWKFGLLERDFRYARFHTHPSGRVVWVSTSGAGEPGAPPFGRGAEVYNVIDSRQAYLQSVVIAGLKALGYAEQAARSTHFSYEMVALSKRCAEEMGYAPAPGEEKKSYVEVSGRRGTGVKADDLLDRLVAAARAEVDGRSPADPAGDRERRAQQIAIGALRYYLLKYTRTTVVAFDFNDALSFEGETGPYCQYAIVRARNIWRKRSEQAAGQGRPPEDSSFFAGSEGGAAAPFLTSPENDEIWELVLLAGLLGSAVEAAIGAQEPAFVAKYAFQLAQAFNNFYHKHHILSEPDEARKAFLLSLAGAVERQLVAGLALLGITSPEKM